MSKNKLFKNYFCLWIKLSLFLMMEKLNYFKHFLKGKFILYFYKNNVFFNLWGIKYFKFIQSIGVVPTYRASLKAINEQIFTLLASRFYNYSYIDNIKNIL